MDMVRAGIDLRLGIILRIELARIKSKIESMESGSGQIINVSNDAWDLINGWGAFCE